MESVVVITNQPKTSNNEENQKWGAVIESIIDNLNNGGDKNALNVKNGGSNKTTNSIYKRTFYESIYLGDLKPSWHSETAKAFQTNDWQDITLDGGCKIFESMDAESIGDLEDLIKKYHVCSYVIRLTMGLAESEKCRDYRDFMRMLEFVAKYIDDDKNGIAHSHATVKHHVSFNNSANIIIPSSARQSITTQSINMKHENNLKFLCCSSFLKGCCRKKSLEQEPASDTDEESETKPEMTVQQQLSIPAEEQATQRPIDNY
ncbi:uncharacterized protein LOC134834971 [Culicoides brevitarsis]|uniref:uncharacterized protein LOC134834971 n=1 Tax=Culicoides brevitarsis TaxID=469753 RepID=UPI00307C1E06